MDISLLTSIIVAVISSVTSISCVLYNQKQLKNIEEKKHMDEITKYRYSKLYELLLNWNSYDSPWEGTTPEEIASSRSMNLYFDDQKRFVVAKPLLDSSYIGELKKIENECELLLRELIENETPDGRHTKKFPVIMKQYRKKTLEFSELLNSAIYNQVIQLLQKH